MTTVIEDCCRRSHRPNSRSPAIGFCRTGNAPAPSAPIAIATAAVVPIRRMRRRRAISADNGDPVDSSCAWRREVTDPAPRLG